MNKQRAVDPPLAGITVLDLTRMLPGAVLARMLADLGARVIKVEKPGTGDPMRAAPPMVDGIGAGFCTFYRGAESICLDLKELGGAAVLHKLASRADVMVESFRPHTLEGWGIGPGRLVEDYSSLVVCSLSGFGVEGPGASRIGHDLNFTGLSGLLSLLPGEKIPRIQLADVTTGLLACSAVLAALLTRSRTGRGTWIDQPLSGSLLPFLAWAMADAAAGGGGLGETLLAGALPAYRLYTCGDGLQIAVCALEVKFWVEFTAMLGLSGLEKSGLDSGRKGREAARQVEEKLATRSRDHWLALADKARLPVTAVHDLESAALKDSGSGPFLPSLGSTPKQPAPRLGEHGDRLVKEFALDTDPAGAPDESA